MINLFGKGFIGGNFAQMYPCIINKRNDLIPQLENVTDIFYTISTIDNYNVKNNPFIDIETNLTLLMRVLENFRKDSRSKDVVFNFASSWFVYGDTDLPALETSYCNPTGFYSVTKRAAEQLLISYCQTFNLKYRILRFANVLGQGDPKTSVQKNAVTHMITELKHNRPINLYDNGMVIRDFIHVKDLCRAIKIVMEEGSFNDIYNIGNSEPFYIKDIIDRVKILGTNSKINLIETPKFHKIVQVKNMYMNTDKLKKLGYKPSYTLQQIVEELYQSA